MTHLIIDYGAGNATHCVALSCHYFSMEFNLAKIATKFSSTPPIVKPDHLARLYGARILLCVVDGKMCDRYAGWGWRVHTAKIAKFLGGEDEVVTKSNRSKIRRQLVAIEQECLMARPEPWLPQLESLEKHFGLTRSESTILTLAVLLQGDPLLNDITSGVEGGRWHLITLISSFTGLSAVQVRDDLQSSGRLYATGFLVKRSGYGNSLHELITPSDAIRFEDLLDGGDARNLIRQLCPIMRPPELQISDFDHYRDDVELISALLRGASAQNAVGINVLLYGVPGSGKTQLARTIIESAGMLGTECADTNRDGDPLSAEDRLSRYLTAQTLLSSVDNSAVLFDEVEELLSEDPIPFHGVSTARDKSWKTRLLEQNLRPTIWIANSIQDIDPALIRRFSYALHVDVPPIKKRKELLANAFAHSEIATDLIDRVAQNNGLTPADIARTQRILKLIPGHSRLDVNEQFARVISARPGGVKARYTARSSVARELPYRLDWLNATPSVMEVSRMLRRRGGGRLGFFGPPGTGKTAFARFLAAELGVRCVVKRASDLLGMHVGQTEQRIAKAFDEAMNNNWLLLIDEIDGLLQSRSQAKSGWEVSQVNELLTQIDEFEGFLVVASNFVEKLDSALSRRIDLKIEFSPLDPAQQKEVFEEAVLVLGDSVSAAESVWCPAEGTFDDLSLGDFAMAIRQCGLRAEEPSARTLFECLLEESRRKATVNSSDIGFLAQLRRRPL